MTTVHEKLQRKPSDYLALAIEEADNLDSELVIASGNWFMRKRKDKVSTCYVCAIGAIARALGYIGTETYTTIGGKDIAWEPIEEIKSFLEIEMPILFSNRKDFNIEEQETLGRDDFDGEESVGNAINHLFENGKKPQEIVNYLKERGL